MRVAMQCEATCHIYPDKTSKGKPVGMQGVHATNPVANPKTYPNQHRN